MPKNWVVFFTIENKETLEGITATAVMPLICVLKLLFYFNIDLIKRRCVCAYVVNTDVKLSAVRRNVLDDLFAKLKRHLVYIISPTVVNVYNTVLAK